jgi:hypothetical protein
MLKINKLINRSREQNRSYHSLSREGEREIHRRMGNGYQNTERRK